MAMNVNFKVSGSGGSSFSLDLEPSMTVLDVKNKAMEKSGVEPAQMKIIFKGKILKDADTLESVQVTAGSSMHIVKSAPSAGAAATTSAPLTHPAPAQAPAPTPPSTEAPAPLGGMMADPAMMQAAMQMMGTGGMASNGNPAGGMLGMGGGGMEQMLQNPEMMMQMLQNPMVQQMMQSISQNPEMLRAMIQNNPMMQQMSQNNPMLQQMLNNPQLLQSMFNPQMLQSMMQMQQTMSGMGAAGAPQISPAPDSQGGAQQAAPPNPMFNPAMMQQMMQAMQGDTSNLMNGGGFPNPTNPTDTRPADERFATQVQQLENMGFPDKHSNLQALSQSNGDVNQAINCLLGGA